MTSETLTSLLRIAYITTFGTVCGMGGAIYGASRHGPPDQSVRDVYKDSPSPARLLLCPVSKTGIEEWARTCRARERMK
jgi:hypothetical protein